MNEEGLPPGEFAEALARLHDALGMPHGEWY